MTEIKFDIKIRHIETGNTFREILTLDEIMTSDKLYTKGIQEVVFKRQFTEKTDKNKKDIFDGDIVMACSESGFEHGTHKGKYFEVVYLVESGAWYIKRVYSESEKMGLFKEMWEMLANCYVEVIGNIYENLELLS